MEIKVFVTYGHTDPELPFALFLPRKHKNQTPKKYTYVANFGFIWIPLAQWPSFFDHLNWKPFKIDFANLKKNPRSFWTYFSQAPPLGSPCLHALTGHLRMGHRSRSSLPYHPHRSFLIWRREVQPCHWPMFEGGQDPDFPVERAVKGCCLWSHWKSLFLLKLNFTVQYLLEPVVLRRVLLLLDT